VASYSELDAYLDEVYSELPDKPSILVDDFIEGAVEVDVDAVSDGETTVVAGIMEHIEGAGIHSGDSACITPPVTLSTEVVATIRDYSVRLADAIGVRGLINIQYVVKDGEVFVIEANPRASRTIPYLSKAIGHPLAKYAALIAAGRTLKELGFTETPDPRLYSVKEVVLPFLKFRNILPVLGPEMRSTGESMGISHDPALAYLKAELAAGAALPASGRIRLIGEGLDALDRRLGALGFEVERGGQPGDPGDGPDYALLVDVAHTTELRRALENGVPYATTVQAASWMVDAIEAAKDGTLAVRALQDG
ncbi:MAG: carbamoyl phosphate synthase large subunit, partial [Deinococcales bacterium]